MKNRYEDARPNIPAEMRRSVEVESGHKCAVKGCLEHTYLEIHHIDNNRENNVVENLIMLCDKHHKMAHANVIDRKALREYKRLISISEINCSKSQDSVSVPSLRIVDLYEIEGVDDDENQATKIEIKLREGLNNHRFSPVSI